jgi:hypothetical protein
MKPRRYASPEAFKQALEQRLRASAKNGGELARKRQLFVFERFLARVVDVLGDAVTLKGGLVLELRLERARTTNDVDLRVVGSPAGMLAQLQEAGRQQVGDFLTFEARPDDEHPAIQDDGMLYEGLRFRVEGKLAGNCPTLRCSRRRSRSMRSAYERRWIRRSILAERMRCPAPYLRPRTRGEHPTKRWPAMTNSRGQRWMT